MMLCMCVCTEALHICCREGEVYLFCGVGFQTFFNDAGHMISYKLLRIQAENGSGEGEEERWGYGW